MCSFFGGYPFPIWQGLEAFEGLLMDGNLTAWRFEKVAGEDVLELCWSMQPFKETDGREEKWRIMLS